MAETGHFMSMCSVRLPVRIPLPPITALAILAKGRGGSWVSHSTIHSLNVGQRGMQVSRTAPNQAICSIRQLVLALAESIRFRYAMNMLACCGFGTKNITTPLSSSTSS